MLHRNVGRADRAVRLAIGIVGLPVGLFPLHGLAGAIPGLILAAVGLVGWPAAPAASASCTCLWTSPRHGSDKAHCRVDTKSDVRP